jgi:hypothetical protein
VDGAVAHDAVTQALADPPVRARHGVVNPIAVAAKERQVLAFLHERPGAATAEVIAAVDDHPAAILARLYRMRDRGDIAKVGRGQWRLPTPVEPPIGEIEEEISEFETAERMSSPAFDPTRWVQHVDYYVRVETSMFACARFG